MIPFKWTCPFCNHDTTITEANYDSDFAILSTDNKHGRKKAVVNFIVCPNPDCAEFTLIVDLYNTHNQNGSWVTGAVVNNWSLIPSSHAKILPDYIPQAILNDYYEACEIKDLSPKASATLSRRCLQGIIRDFWNVSKHSLFLEIEAIKDKVDSLTWNAIDAVRKIGNIGAHMERDINQIIDVEPEEAALLIELIETLISDWYINRYERQKRFESIIGVKDKIDSEKRKSDETP